MGKNFHETLAERMQGPEFKAEWDALAPERQIMRAIVEERENCDLTQQQLAEAIGIAQADISRLENGTENPSLRILKRLTTSMGMALKLVFVPILPAGQRGSELPYPVCRLEQPSSADNPP